MRMLSSKRPTYSVNVSDHICYANNALFREDSPCLILHGYIVYELQLLDVALDRALHSLPKNTTQYSPKPYHIVKLPDLPSDVSTVLPDSRWPPSVTPYTQIMSMCGCRKGGMWGRRGGERRCALDLVKTWCVCHKSKWHRALRPERNKHRPLFNIGMDPRRRILGNVQFSILC